MSGIRCSGPRTGAIFIQRDINNIYDETDRKLLNSSIRHQSSGAPGHAKRPERLNLVDTSVPKPHAPLATTPDIGCNPSVYRSLVDDFWLSTRTFADTPSRQDVHLPISFGTLIIYPEVFSNEALGNAIFAVSAMYLGTKRGDPKLLGLAMVAYPSALRRFRSELNSAFDAKAGGHANGLDSVMAIVLSLLLFEVSLIAMIRKSRSSLTCQQQLLIARL
jgi:hypothetical protein